MTPSPDQAPESDWQKYLHEKALAFEAAQRAKETHEERREQEPEEQKARTEAQIERVDDLAHARELRAAEIEFERMERERLGIDADKERVALAKERRDAAAESRDADLSTVESDRADAIATAAQQASQTLREHAEEFAKLNDATSAEYKALVDTKVVTATRMHEYRSERDIEQAKIDEERRGAAAMMAQQARETRLLREQDDDKQPAARAADKSEVRALAALMGSSKRKSKKAAGTPTVTAMDEVRQELAAIRGEVLEPPSDVKVSAESASRGFIGKLLGSLRRAS